MNSSEIIKRSADVICDHLDPLLREASELSLLDFPNHPNVGDSAIWAGEIAYLESRGHKPRHVSDKGAMDWEAVSRLRGPILLHGGGNFGDVWPEHQHFRNQVMARFPDRKIIQLPQTVQFSSPAAAAETRKIVQAHPDFTLFVRDRRSQEQTRTLLDIEPVLVPDMAFCLGRICRQRTADRDLLLLLRTDKERRREISEASALPGRVEDWMTDRKGFYKLAKVRTAFNPNNWHRENHRFELFKSLANARLRRGLSMIARYRFIITDRLHCHILCVLQDIPHVVMDNNYGKISHFIKAWTADYDQLELADGIKAAVRAYRARALLALEGSPAIAMKELETRA
ncbi:MAG TPA: polysaccharide pyruvyl transferase family protein [Rhizomicrobium sp.]|nr:polysaccharide pyruvyl transferase family protein [Rhizomicrobium sp.]